MAQEKSLYLKADEEMLSQENGYLSTGKSEHKQFTNHNDFQTYIFE